MKVDHLFSDKNKYCAIWGPQWAATEDSRPLGCDAVQLGS